jgi:hypothetical protein
MTDETEPLRRAMLAEQRATGPRTREDLAAQYGDVWDTGEMSAKFRVKSFLAPFVVVEEHGPDGRIGTLEFQHYPRFYHSFVAD